MPIVSVANYAHLYFNVELFMSPASKKHIDRRRPDSLACVKAKVFYAAKMSVRLCWMQSSLEILKAPKEALPLCTSPQRGRSKTAKLCIDDSGMHCSRSACTNHNMFWKRLSFEGHLNMKIHQKIHQHQQSLFTQRQCSTVKLGTFGCLG